jgi:arsenate reductase (glutaredoxin)
MTLTLFGIPNCDTVRKARAWLDARGLAHAFHDYKKAGIDAATLSGWAKEVGWEVLLNRGGTTWRKLPDEAREGVDEGRAIALMVDQPSLIKRPVVTSGTRLLVGFKPAEWETALG